MKFIKTNIPDLIICEPTKINDKRGFFLESFRKDLFEGFIGEKINFCQENISESKYGVLRGLHFQKEPFAQSKLVSVQMGKILDVVVDIRKKSKFYGKSFGIELDNLSCKHLFIPKGFAHGFITLTKLARVSYKVNNYYNPDFEEGLNYDDPKLKINWKIDKESIIIKNKDKKYLSFDTKTFFV